MQVILYIYIYIYNYSIAVLCSQAGYYITSMLAFNNIVS